MDFAFDEQQREIQEAAERLMRELAPLERVIELSQSDEGFSRDDYARLADLGWTGLQIPEAYGGVGLSFVELVVVLEQMGRVLYPSPFFATVCLAANALIEGAAAEPLTDENASLLAAIAAGEKTATLAGCSAGFDGVPGAGPVAGSGSEDATAGCDGLVVRADGDDFVIDGTAAYVIDGHTADAIVVAARAADGTGSGADGDVVEVDREPAVTLLAVPGDAPGLARVPVHALDETRKLAALTFADVRVPTSAVIGRPGAAAPVLRATLQLAAVALSAESLGAMQHCFDTALLYTKDRYQFGRPIASFQAVKHICADLLLAVEQSRSAVYYAGWAAAQQRDELPVVAPLAKAQVHDALWEAARMNIQLHGGIGFTYEHDAHRYYRRATASRALLGGGDHHREMMLRGLGV